MQTLFEESLTLIVRIWMACFISEREDHTWQGRRILEQAVCVCVCVCVCVLEMDGECASHMCFSASFSSPFNFSMIVTDHVWN